MEEADPLALSARQHWAYCPRQCGLIHLEQAFDDNLHTQRGQAVHALVDRPGVEERKGLRVERALPLWNDTLGLIGKADVVEFEPDGTPYPVEYKHGSRNKAAGIAACDDVQLAAQAMCLEAMTDRAVPEGALFYATSKRRRLATDDAPRALALARAIVAGKLKNQRQVLLRGSREAKAEDDRAPLERAAQDLAASLRALPAADKLDTLRGIEGEAARNYFEVLNRLVRADRREAFAMNGRSRRPPRDRMNALMSFLYAMWMNDCRSACEAAGLDAQVGFLHALRPGRAALALDLVEEFRPFADRLALSLINRGQLDADDFDVREGGGVSLQADARKAVVVAFQERKQETITHPLTAEPLALGLVPLVQARLLARCVRGDTEGYLPFTTK